eukprot:1159326-Pelagomonas_calceolata.AAC.5
MHKRLGVIMCAALLHLKVAFHVGLHAHSRVKNSWLLTNVCMSWCYKVDFLFCICAHHLIPILPPVPPGLVARSPRSCGHQVAALVACYAVVLVASHVAHPAGAGAAATPLACPLCPAAAAAAAAAPANPLACPVHPAVGAGAAAAAAAQQHAAHA